MQRDAQFKHTHVKPSVQKTTTAVSKSNWTHAQKLDISIGFKNNPFLIEMTVTLETVNL